MKVEYKEHARKALAKAPLRVRKAFFKQVRLLEQNLRHPSLHAKKYDEAQDRWHGPTEQRIAQGRPLAVTLKV
jgi:mRNA-degrading endonuclease RelE of RelBE toxin-antitoxin system